MSKIVGIDLGTTNSLVATVDSGIPLIIPDAEGNRLTPSVVHFPKGVDEPIVGHGANRARVLSPSETVYSIKRFMGRRRVEISDEEMLVAYPVSGNSTDRVTINIHGRALTPEEISAAILQKLKRDAEAYFGEAISRAVITVPAYFNDAQRTATKRAGELVGLHVERIVNEPTAAALAYGLDRLKERAKIAVYDLGGGTFDLSILELSDGVFQVLSTSGDTRLGGDDLDRRIIDFLVDQIRNDRGPEAAGDLALLSRIREAAEQCKIKLSTELEVEVALPFLKPDYSFVYKFARSQLETLTRDIIARTRQHCLRALADAKLESKDLDQVILVGGQTRMPLVRQMVTEIFQCAEFDETRGNMRLGRNFHRSAGPLLNTSQNPEEAVALGAAIQAEILSGGFRNILLLDVTPLSLGLETFGGLMNVIIPRNSTIPTKAGEVFTTAINDQASMLIHVLQGERERAHDNWSLGRFTLSFEPGPRGVARVGVQFEIDANGILHVLARDLKTGKQTIVDVKSAVDVDDSEVQKMIEDSVEHAFDDMQARQWIEAKVRAHELRAATTKALAQHSHEISPDGKAQIESAMQGVEEALRSEDPQTQIGNRNELQAAMRSLDEATQSLADLLMDKAMETALRNQGFLR